MTDGRPYDDDAFEAAFPSDPGTTEYDDVPGPGTYVPEDDDRSFGWEDDAPGRFGGGGGRGRGGGGAHHATPRRRGRGSILLGVAIVALLVLGATGVWVQRQLNPAGSPSNPHTVVIAKGASSSAIGKQLASDGVITSSFVWDWYLRINGGGPFEAGEYQLSDHSSMGDVVEALSRGPLPPVEKRVTIPEGFTVKQTLARLADPTKGLGLSLAALQAALAGGQVRSEYQPAGTASSEGILFPDTYEFDPKKLDPLTVLQQMAAQLDETMGALDVTSAQAKYNLTPYEVLIIASLIEEETKVPDERPMVARVIFNRLKQGIALGIDATSRYEAELAGRDRSKVNFNSTSAYNTRKHKGLPPTPIASPGRASIEAALHPADGPWTYYVLKDAQGHHFFTDSPAEFNAAKQRCHDAGLGCG